MPSSFFGERGVLTPRATQALGAFTRPRSPLNTAPTAVVRPVIRAAADYAIHRRIRRGCELPRSARCARPRRAPRRRSANNSHRDDETARAPLDHAPLDAAAKPERLSLLRSAIR